MSSINPRFGVTGMLSVSQAALFASVFFALLCILAALWSSFLYCLDFPVKDTLRVYRDFFSVEHIDLTYFLVPQNGHFAFNTLLIQYLDFISPIAPNHLAVYISILFLVLAFAGCIYFCQKSSISIELFVFIAILFALFLFNPMRHHDLYWGFKVHDSLMLSGAIWLGAIAFSENSTTSCKREIFNALGMSVWAFAAGAAAAGGFVLTLIILIISLLFQFRWSLLAPLIVTVGCGYLSLGENFKSLGSPGSANNDSAIGNPILERVVDIAISTVGSIGNYPITILFGTNVSQNDLRIGAGCAGIILSALLVVSIWRTLQCEADRSQRSLLLWLVSLMGGAICMLLAIMAVRTASNDVDALIAFPRFLSWSGLYWTSSTCALAAILSRLPGFRHVIAGVALITCLAYTKVFDKGIQAARYIDRIYYARAVGAAAAYPDMLDLYDSIGPQHSLGYVSKALADYRKRTGAILAFNSLQARESEPECASAILKISHQQPSSNASHATLSLRGCRTTYPEAYLVSDGGNVAGISLWPASMAKSGGYFATIRFLYDDSRLNTTAGMDFDFAYLVPSDVFTDDPIFAYVRDQGGMLANLGCVYKCSNGSGQSSVPGLRNSLANFSFSLR